jgi:hypothetical protein
MAVRFLACFLIFAAVAGAAEKDPKKDPKWVKKVHATIDKGVAWLISKQEASGRFPSFEDSRGAYYELGMHALSTYAVIHGGHPLDSEEVRKALRKLHSLIKRHRNNLYTYEVGLTLLVLEAQYFAAPLNKKGKRVKRKKAKISPSDLAVAQDLTTWLLTKQRPEGMWRYPEGGVDLSNTQYAALGLWAAQRLGVRIKPQVVRRMMEAVLERQQKTGPQVPFILDPTLHRRKTAKTGERRSGTQIEAKGWRYLPKELIKLPDGTMKERVYPYSGSMTSAGIACLAIGREILGKNDKWLDKARDRQVRRSMWEGLAWIQNNWDLKDNPGQPGNWPFYWIYGLERCCRLSGVQYVGLRDWYFEGAERLIADQRPDGSWPLRKRMRAPGGANERWNSDQVDTCFAVLFLARSTPELKTPPPTITGG